MAAFGRVQRFALGKAGVFGMPEHEILHAELRCRFAGFTDRAVVLFVGLEAVAVRIEAESFTEEPAADFRPRGVQGSSPRQESFLPLWRPNMKPNCFALVEPMSKKVAR